MQPCIAVPYPTSFDHTYNRLNIASFTRAIEQAGAEAVLIDLAMPASDQVRLASSCQGILLPGSPADVAPEGYGHPLEEHTARADPSREQTDRLLIEHAYQHKKALLTVCFGTQMLNTHAGGTLVQNLSVLPVNHAAASSVGVAHTCTFAPNSLLAELVAAEEVSGDGKLFRFPVNSSHHQAIAIAGAAFVVSGRCPQDGVVEALELGERTSHFVLGVQWHPERTLTGSQTSRNLFARLVKEAS